MMRRGKGGQRLIDGYAPGRALQEKVQDVPIITTGVLERVGHDEDDRLVLQGLPGQLDDEAREPGFLEWFLALDEVVAGFHEGLDAAFLALFAFGDEAAFAEAARVAVEGIATVSAFGHDAAGGAALVEALEGFGLEPGDEGEPSLDGSCHVVVTPSPA
jgi:hypothetical protein